MLKYYFTKFGEVFAGWEFTEHEFPDYTIVIQGTKLKDYLKLTGKEKTLDKISEYGWVLGNNTIVGVLGSDQFNPEIRHFQGEWWLGEYERKELFIFGAGASANCIDGSELNSFQKDELRPPLGMGLFDKRFKGYYENYPGVKNSLHSLQKNGGVDVESLLEHEWTNIYRDNNEQVLRRHINIQYYIQRVLKDCSEHIGKSYTESLYSEFADKLQKIHAKKTKVGQYGRKTQKNFAFVSFNQDTILDTALSSFFENPLNQMSQYANYNDSPFCLFKPHGSWNWGWRFPETGRFGNNTPNWLYENKIDYFKLYYELLGDHVSMIDWSTWGIELSNSKHHLGRYTIDKSQLQIISQNANLNNYFPGLLLPYRDKDEFTMPLQHFIAMQGYIHNIETVIIIGWKGNEAAFNRMLVNQGNRIKKVIIADPNPKTVEANLKELLDRNKIQPIHYSGFKDFVENGIDKEID